MDFKNPSGFSISIEGQTELSQLIRDWVRTNMGEFPSETQVMSLIMTLLERAAISWFRLAPPEKAFMLNRDIYLNTAKATFEGRSKGHLEARIEPQGPRHYLDGRIVNVGDIIEIQLDGGVWSRGEYHWTFTDTEKPYVRTPDGEVFEIIPGAILRWPAQSSGGFPN